MNNRKIIIISFLVLFIIGGLFFLKYKKSILEFQKPENNQTMSVKISDKSNFETEKIKEDKIQENFESEPGKIVLYFNNEKKDPEAECGKVFPVIRNAEKGNSPTLILNALFSGPNEEEKKEGFYSEFSKKSTGLLNKIAIKDKVAYVDLKDKLGTMENVTTSCGSLNFFRQVEETLKTNFKVERVVYAILGNPETFYTTWMQMSCPNDYIEDCTPQGFRKLIN